jgi:hypothetical protein
VHLGRRQVHVPYQLLHQLLPAWMVWKMEYITPVKKNSIEYMLQPSHPVRSPCFYNYIQVLDG